MTKEEAINILYGIRADNLNDAYTKDKYEALDMAIKALEQEPTTKNDLEVDCIDRTEVLKAMDSWDKFGVDTDGKIFPLYHRVEQKMFVPYVHYEDMVNCVKGMPSVTPQEPKPIVEIDLYSVIKQKYIEREVLDKIRAEIKDWQTDIHDNEYDADKYDFAFERIFEIIDEYKAKSEG